VAAHQRRLPRSPVGLDIEWVDPPGCPPRVSWRLYRQVERAQAAVFLVTGLWPTRAELTLDAKWQLAGFSVDLGALV
jgi:hypothetical protein